MKKLIVMLLALSLWACDDESKKTVKVVKASESKPYMVIVKKERSYYQAEKIAGHLKDLGIPAYVIERGEEGNRWYYVASGAFSSKESAEINKSGLVKDHQINVDTIISYSDLSETERYHMVDGKPPREEIRKIPAQTPGVPSVVLQTVEKVPLSNAFYIGRMGLINFSQGNFASISSLSLPLDLPRGIGLKYLSSVGEAFTEVVLTDNLFGDRVTFDVVHLKSGTNGGKIVAEVAGKILDTDNYEVEEKTPISIRAYAMLDGYVVTIQTKAKKKGSSKMRSYYVLVDSSDEYLFVVQSVEKDDASLRRLIAEIGKSGGLNEYSEFWNSFYLIPKYLEDDIFLAYSTTRLGWDYARSKGNTVWAKRMVYHWEYSMHFYAPGKGLWEYSAFDLTSDSYRQKTWANYSQQLGSLPKRKFCGTTGHAVGTWGGLEINYSKERYIIALDARTSQFSEKNLINRAEKFQYACSH